MTEITLTMPALTEEQAASENLVARQANALVILTDDDYKAAQTFLDEVIVPGERQVLALFDPHVSRAYDAHHALTQDRGKHLRPWTAAKAIVKSAMGKYWLDRETERRRLEDDRRREAKRLADEQAEADAKAAREESELHAEKLRDEAANLPAPAAKVLEERAAVVEQEGRQAAQAILAAPAAMAVPDVPQAKLKGAAAPWKCDRESWDSVALAEWIAQDPKGRAKYIGAPNWTLLDAEAKAQGDHFHVGGIHAGPKVTVRAGASRGSK